jgi:hypothetical protein
VNFRQYPDEESSMRVGPVASKLQASALAGLVGLFALWGLLTPSIGSAAPPFEPNDTLTTASGPLAINTTYEGYVETTNDNDYFYFYVTAASTSQVKLTVRNFGGGTESYGLGTDIEDSHGSNVAESYTRVNDYDIMAVTLTPGKYYVHVDSGFGNRYTFTTEGTDGAFGAFSTIAANCAAANSQVASAQGNVAAAQGNMTTTQANLQAAKAKLAKAQRKNARRAIRRARKGIAIAAANAKVAQESLDAANEGYKSATKLQQPWCFIPA